MLAAISDWHFYMQQREICFIKQRFVGIFYMQQREICLIKQQNRVLRSFQYSNPSQAATFFIQLNYCFLVLDLEEILPMKPNFAILLLLALLFRAQSQQTAIQDATQLANQYPTSTKRTPTVTTQCPKPRFEIVQSQKNNPRRDYLLDQTSRDLGVDADIFFGYIVSGNTDIAVQKVKENPTKVVLYFVFYFIGLGVLIISAPFLLSCCLCPGTCPPCCRKDPSQEYAQRSLTIAYIIVVVLSVLIITAMIIALATGHTISETYRSTRCGFAIMFDDILNGNETTDHKNFFIGTHVLHKQLVIFNENISTFSGEVEKVSSSGSLTNEILANMSTAAENLKNVPDGQGGPLVLEYPSPINSDSPQDVVSSTFPGTLGTASKTFTTVWKIDKKIQTQSVSLSLVSKSADTVKEGTDKFTTAFNTSLEKLETFSQKVATADANLDIKFQSMEDQYVKPINTLTLILMIGIIVVGLGIIGAVCVMKFLKWPSGRLILALCTYMLFILGVLSFITTIVLSGTTTASYLACDYFQTGIKSPQQFYTHFKPIFKNDDVTQKVATCVPSGNGSLVEMIIGPNIVGYLESSQALFDKLSGFDSTASGSLLSNSVTGFSQTVSDYMTARVLDIDSAVDQQALNNISQSSRFPFCVDAKFAKDSWVPSIFQDPTYIECSLSEANDANSTQCTTANLASASSGCSGCLDSYDILNQYNQQAEVLAGLAARYPSCPTFNKQLTNIWKNFYKVKKDTLGGVYQRAKSSQTEIQSIGDSISTNLKPTFINALTELSSSFSTILDPEYGLITGLNCRLVGEDVQLMINILCNEVFVHSYILKILFAVASFCILAMMFCVTLVIGMHDHNDQIPRGNQNPYSEVIQQEQNDPKPNDS